MKCPLSWIEANRTIALGRSYANVLGDGSGERRKTGNLLRAYAGKISWIQAAEGQVKRPAKNPSRSKRPIIFASVL